MKFRQPGIIRLLKNKSTVPTEPRVRCSYGDETQDNGNAPYILNISDTVKSNPNFRVALWTSPRLQLTAMSIPKGESTGIEMHNGMDQFIKVESGICDVIMGISPEKMDIKERIDSRYAVLIPAGTYHNIINTGAYPVKLFSLYSPKNHPFGTVDETKSDADERERKEDEKKENVKRSADRLS